MAKKHKPETTFIVRFVGEGLSPDRIPFRAVSEALSAIQDLASGRDPFETQQVPPDKTIGLVDVQSGSAKYLCVARAPDEAVHNLNRFGHLLTSIGNKRSRPDNEQLVAAIKPIKALSEIAKQFDCKLEVSLATAPREPIFAIEKNDYRRIAGRLFMKGLTTISGTIQRVGGATGMRCLMRIANRRKLLFCDVKAKPGIETKELVRKLGQHLYEEVSATGEAVWIHRTWYIYKFTIHDFGQPRLGDPFELIESLRDSGLNAWDDVDDPEELIRGFRQ